MMNIKNIKKKFVAYVKLHEKKILMHILKKKVDINKLKGINVKKKIDVKEWKGDQIN
jgi:hypothetical protein